MALDHLQFLRGDADENDNYTGLDGEITVDKSRRGVRIHDGSKAGGDLVVPEELTRASNVNDLKTVVPSQNRFVVVDGKQSQFDGSGGIAVWDANADATNANGTTKIESNVSGYQAGEPREGLWVVIVGLLDELKDFGQARFDGDGNTTVFKASHGIGVTPESWRVTPATDDASGVSHVTANDKELTFYFDYAPPSGTKNVVINWVVEQKGSIVDLQTTFDTTTFDGDGTSLEYCIPHGYNGIPATWQVEALNDDTSGISHVTADSVNICVKYDSPPPAGSNNIAFNWFADPGTFNASSQEDGGVQVFSGDGSSTTFAIPHNLGSTPSFAVTSMVSDDASGMTFVDTNSSEIIVNYDTPPPSGTNNLSIAWYAGTTTFSGSNDEAAGIYTDSGDGSTLEFNIPHGLPSVPVNAIVTENTDDATAISHVTYDATNINVFYDSPPPTGSGNLEINWYAKA